MKNIINFLWVGCFPYMTVFGKCIDKQYDYIIVGSGSAGSIIATRLSEDSKTKVLLLEAGGKPPFASFVPLTSYKERIKNDSKIVWNYFTESQEHCCQSATDNKVQLVRGKTLGGTSSINSMAYTRGNKRDYDSWGQNNPGWRHKDVLPYFMKLEDYNVPTAPQDIPYHRKGGPMSVEIPSFKTPLADAFLQAGHELNQPWVDYNAKSQIGFMYPPVTIKNGERCSTYRCYLQPVMSRRNLQVIINALVTKILINNKTAIEVLYEKDGATCTAKVRKEVVISAGSLNSPQLLMLSGIGPQETLEKYNIPVNAHLPGVGQNLQDHVVQSSYLYILDKPVSYNALRYETEYYLDLWNQTRTGPMTCPEAYEGIAYYQTKYTKENDWPDIELYYNSDSVIRFVDQSLDPSFAATFPSKETDVMSFVILLLRPKSRGFLTITSSDPHKPPLINPKYLSNEDDVKTLIEGMKFVKKLGETKAFQQYNAQLLFNGSIPQCYSQGSDKMDDAYDECVARLFASTGEHQSSTCKMGPRSDSMAVVDHRLRVHGIRNLRVADGSIMPTIVSGHLNAPCMMIGEKAADMIKEDSKKV